MQNTKQVVKVIGGGLAGSECAYYLAKKGYEVELYDIKPNSFTPAHHDKNYGELVCSNSLKSNDSQGNACGLLKQELRILGSMVIDCADKTSVPAGNALAVNRDEFAQMITDKLKSCANIKFISQAVESFDLNDNVIVATGPLTVGKLTDYIGQITGSPLYFFDASAPIVSASSIDMTNAFIADRYGEEGTGDYINCPMDKQTYELFHTELISAKRAELHEFENAKVFDGCMPVEVMASRGVDSLRFGPLKPVGLTDPKTGRWAYACMQLRKEDKNGQMYNIVGFQTNLLFSEQKRVFGMFPALKNAEYYRYGVMHKNTFLNSPQLLTEHYCMKEHKNIFFAGQITGVEGYVESIASGLSCGINMHALLQGKPFVEFPETTMLGSLSKYIATPNVNFQPMNSNFGIIAPIDYNRRKKSEKKVKMSQRAIEVMTQINSKLNY